MIGKENGTAASFMSFFTLIVDTGWLVHDKILFWTTQPSTQMERLKTLKNGSGRRL
jgi:hypothetical protein